MKRIGIFSIAYLPRIGGAEVAIKEISDRISDTEFHMFTLYFGKGLREEKIGNVYVHRVGNDGSYLSKILFAPRAARAAYRTHQERPFDGLWAMMSYMLFPIVLARFLGLRVPYLLSLQEGDPWSYMFSRWFILPLRPLLSIGFRRATVVQTISTYLAEWPKKLGYAGVVEIIPNGCDIKRFGGEFSHARRREFWEQRRIPSSGVILITTSRLVHKNAVDTIIRAVALLSEEVRLVVLGDGEDRALLEQLSKKLKVADRVHFLGEVLHANTPEYLHAADIFVRPSRTEGMGISFVEAMAAGLPVVATQVGGITDFLFDAKRNPEKETTGWAIDVDAPEQVAVVIRDILANKDRTRQVTAAAKKLVSENYEWDRVARDMRSLFGRLFQNR